MAYKPFLSIFKSSQELSVNHILAELLCANLKIVITRTEFELDKEKKEK